MQTAIFDNVAKADHLSFGHGAGFRAQQVAEFLDFNKSDVSRIAAVSVNSVRWDVDRIPQPVRERLEEIGDIANMVAGFFDGDAAKTALWFRSRNPMLGNVAPRDMVRLGRYERLRSYIVSALRENQR